MATEITWIFGLSISIPLSLGVSVLIESSALGNCTVHSEIVIFARNIAFQTRLAVQTHPPVNCKIKSTSMSNHLPNTQ